MFVKSLFEPNWWLKSRHLQTMWGAVFRLGKQLPAKQRCRLELADGDFIDVDLFLSQEAKTKAPFVLLLHGLEGNLDSHYIRGMVSEFVSSGKQVAVMHFRGCSGETNRKAASYHSGVSDDLELVLNLLAQREIQIDFLVGFSLGGNVLLKWLGENHAEYNIKAAVAVSVPFLLDECATAMEQGFSKVYSRRLLNTLRIKTHQKKRLFPEKIMLTRKEINQLKTFWQFDEKVTAQLHGFDNASDYYQKASSRQFLKSIEIPTLVIHAKDDPFMNSKVIPRANELSSSVEFELNEHGGHVGFVRGRWPWSIEYYLEQRIPAFLERFI